MKVVIVALALVVFHGPTGLLVYINPDKVGGLRNPSTYTQGHWAKGVHCIILGANRVIATVREECDEARQQLGKPTPAVGGPPCALVCGEAPKR